MEFQVKVRWNNVRKMISKISYLSYSCVVITKGCVCLFPRICPKYYKTASWIVLVVLFRFTPLETGFSCSPGYPETHYIDHTGFELFLPVHFRVLWLKTLHEYSFYLVIRKSCEMIFFIFFFLRKKMSYMKYSFTL